MNTIEQKLLHEAILEAKLGSASGGIPIGSVLADVDGNIVSRGHISGYKPAIPRPTLRLCASEMPDVERIGTNLRW